MTEEIIVKRKTVKSLFCAALMALTLSVTACGGSDDGDKSTAAAQEAAPAESEASEEAAPEEETPVEEEVPVEEETPAEEEVSSSEATLEDYLKGDAETAKQLDEQAQSMGNENVDMAIEVNGNDLVYIATLKEEIEDPDALVDAVEQMGSAFSALAGMMDEAIGVEKGTISFGIRYCAPDGTVLAESNFRAE